MSVCVCVCGGGVMNSGRPGLPADTEVEAACWKGGTGGCVYGGMVVLHELVLRR